MADSNDPREAAIRRIKMKKAAKGHIVVYVLVNALLVGIWATSNRGYFWPLWPMLGWGVGLAIHTWTAFGGGKISEGDVEREMAKGRETIG